jgi:hypothetical protein
MPITHEHVVEKEASIPETTPDHVFGSPSLAHSCSQYFCNQIVGVVECLRPCPVYQARDLVDVNLWTIKNSEAPLNIDPLTELLGESIE